MLMHKHNGLRTFICCTSGPVQNSECLQNRKDCIIHNGLISNRLCTVGGHTQCAKTVTVLSGTKTQEPHFNNIHIHNEK